MHKNEIEDLGAIAVMAVFVIIILILVILSYKVI